MVTPVFNVVLVAALFNLISPPSSPIEFVDSSIGAFAVVPSNVKFASPLKGVGPLPVAVTT
jgi:hypothetical protein